MISFRAVSKTDVRRWMCFGLVTLAAIRIYYVGEMFAMPIIFSVLFASVAALASILFVLDRASQRSLAWAGKKCGCGTDTMFISGTKDRGGEALWRQGVFDKTRTD